MKSCISILIIAAIEVLSLITLPATSYPANKDDNTLLSPKEMDEMIERAEKEEYCTKYESEENQESKELKAIIEEGKLAQRKLYLLISEDLISRETWLKNNEHWKDMTNQAGSDIKQLKKERFDECMSK